MNLRTALLVVPLLVLAPSRAEAERASGPWDVAQRGDVLVITKGGAPVAEFVLRDAAMRRPGLANLHAPAGAAVTRAFPPREGIDATDHAAMHPGIWLAFGDVSGQDFWRNKATMEHDGFPVDPAATADGVRFAARSLLRAEDGARLGAIVNRIAIVDRPEGRVVAWLATIRARAAPLVLGDQEEMGFGVRLATGLEEKAGGRIVNSAGDTTAKGTWGRPADWCDASASVGAGTAIAGITVVAAPGNVRPCWWHNRDYGLLVANPFGRQALSGGDPSRVMVAPETPLRLGFAAVLHESSAEGPAHDPAAAAAAALEVLRNEDARGGERE